MSPCQTCGACCVAFRVDFHPAELAGGAFAWGEGVDLPLTVPVTSHIVRMKGTDDAERRCVALEGKVGEFVSCCIYEKRPSPCREFDIQHEACHRARKMCGLPPLEMT